MHQPGRQSPSSLKAVQKGDLKTGQVGGAKFQKPNSKSQTDSKFQNTKHAGCHPVDTGWFWAFGLWNSFVIWNLRFGICSSRSSFQFVQLRARLAGVETGRGQAACQPVAVIRAQRAGDSPAAVDSEAAPEGNDLAPRPPFGSVGPRAGLLVKVEERRHDLVHIAPIAGIVGLKKQAAAGDQSAVNQGQERGREQPTLGLPWIVIWLRVIAMHFGEAGGRQV